MRSVLAILALTLTFTLVGAAQAQVYRWTDEKGAVTYSNTVPPVGAQANVIGVDAKGGFVSPDALDCYTLRCQGERLEPRLERRELADAQDFALRTAAAPPAVRGLDFRKYISIQRGMSEGELLGIAGTPDLQRRDRSLDTYTYMPTPADPFTTTITLLRGRVYEIERAHKF
jgi:hypothetical protein